MLNSLETYRECGRRAAKAINEGDWARAQFERDWLSRAVALEAPPTDRTMARNAYAAGYSETRNFAFPKR